jgi:hypothetical protein
LAEKIFLFFLWEPEKTAGLDSPYRILAKRKRGLAERKWKGRGFFDGTGWRSLLRFPWKGVEMSGLSEKRGVVKIREESLMIGILSNLALAIGAY